MKVWYAIVHKRSTLINVMQAITKSRFNTTALPAFCKLAYL